MDLTARWLPVLKKCSEYSEKEYPILAQLLENQYKEWDIDDIASFTRFILPLCRFTVRKLLDSGFKIVVLEHALDTVKKPITILSGIDIDDLREIKDSHIELDLMQLLVDQLVESLIQEFPKKELDLYLLAISNPELVSDSNDFSLRKKHKIVMCINE